MYLTCTDLWYDLCNLSVHLALDVLSMIYHFILFPSCHVSQHMAERFHHDGAFRLSVHLLLLIAATFVSHGILLQLPEIFRFIIMLIVSGNIFVSLLLEETRIKDKV